MQINDIVDAIAIKLHKTFGDSFTIYTESIEQGFEEPCFFIALLEPDQQQLVGNRYHKTLPFDIHYFGKGNVDAYNTADTLMNEMEYIKALNGDLFRGTKMKSDIVNGVLHFFVNYNFHVYKITDPLDKMGDLKIKERIEGVNVTKQKPIKQPVEDSSFDFDKQQSTEVATFKFTKEQLVVSKKYSLNRDVLNALLEDGQVYTFEEVDEQLNDFLKGKVKR